MKTPNTEQKTKHRDTHTCIGGKSSHTN